MTEKFIPIATQELVRQQWNIPSPLIKSNGVLLDQFRRPLEDLRISVTDRCNFRCTYCMPKEVFNKDYVYLPQEDILRFEEITRVAKEFVAHGVKKIRLTGGEPLLRKNIEELIHMLSQLRTTKGEKIDLTLTTNGALLARKAKVLKAAGLTRITVSLDALDDPCFRRMNDVEFPVQDVLDGIQSAQEAGFDNIKINMVVKAGVNDQEIIPMARYFKNTPHALRFIEYMDVGASNAWKLDEVVTSETIRQRLSDAGMPLTPIDPRSASETARRWRHQDIGSEVGFISSVSQAFCRDCSRIRLSTQGMLYTCLFATQGHDLRSILRKSDIDENYLSVVIRSIWENRNDRYSELRSQQQGQERKKIEMSYIGG